MRENWNLRAWSDGMKELSDITRWKTAGEVKAGTCARLMWDDDSPDAILLLETTYSGGSRVSLRREIYEELARAFEQEADLFILDPEKMAVEIHRFHLSDFNPEYREVGREEPNQFCDDWQYYRNPDDSIQQYFELSQNFKAFAQSVDEDPSRRNVRCV